MLEVFILDPSLHEMRWVKENAIYRRKRFRLSIILRRWQRQFSEYFLIIFASPHWEGSHMDVVIEGELKWGAYIKELDSADFSFRRTSAPCHFLQFYCKDLKILLFCQQEKCSQEPKYLFIPRRTLRMPKAVVLFLQQKTSLLRKSESQDCQTHNHFGNWYVRKKK